MLYPTGLHGLAGEVGCRLYRTQPSQSGQQQFQEGLAEVKASCSPGTEAQCSQSFKYLLQPRITPIVLAGSWGTQEDPEGG